MEFKDYFKKERTKISLSQADISKDLNVSQSLVAKWERGECTPNYEKLTDIADYFKTDINNLLGYIPNDMQFRTRELEKLADRLGLNSMTKEQREQWEQSATILANGILKK